MTLTNLTLALNITVYIFGFLIMAGFTASAMQDDKYSRFNVHIKFWTVIITSLGWPFVLGIILNDIFRKLLPEK